MKLHVLGCHGPFPGADGATSGYLIEHEGEAILMDCGSGILGRLMKKWDPAKLSGIVMSHLHFDHACDLLVLRYYLEKMGRTIRVYVPNEDDSPFKKLLESPAFEVLPYPEKLSLAGLEITSFPVRHPAPCRALRFYDGEKTLVFTGDTNDCDGLAHFAMNAQVLLADGAFLESEWKENLPHMSAAGAARLAKEAAVQRLFITHLPIAHDPKTLENEAKTIHAEAQAVSPGMVITL